MDKDQQKIIENRNNFKAGFYTLIIFAIILFIWILTNPLFKKKEVKPEPAVSPEVTKRVDSISESFKTTWSTVSEGIKSFKK